MSELSVKDIQAGKIRLAIIRPDGYYLQHHDTPSMTTSQSGYGATPELLRTLDEKKIPTFTLTSKDSSYRFVPILPNINAHEPNRAPWSSISSVPPTVGLSMMALGADKTAHVEPIKLPLALFSEKMRENLTAAAIANNKHDHLVDLPIKSSAEFFDRPDKYFAEVISKITPPEMKGLTTGLMGSLDLLNKQISEVNNMPKPTDENSRMDLFEQKRGMEKQQALLLDHISRVNETILIGRANDWTPAKILQVAAEQVKFKNESIKQVHQKMVERETVDPSDMAKYLFSQKMERLVDKILNALRMDFGISH